MTLRKTFNHFGRLSAKYNRKGVPHVFILLHRLMVPSLFLSGKLFDSFTSAFHFCFSFCFLLLILKDCFYCSLLFLYPFTVLYCFNIILLFFTVLKFFYCSLLFQCHYTENDLSVKQELFF